MANTVENINLLIIDTNKKSLEKHNIKNKLQIGKTGLGAGSKPEIGKKALQESKEKVRRYLEGYDLIFLVAGFGGGTGTGVLPEIAKLLKEAGILTISVIAKPFDSSQLALQLFAILMSALLFLGCIRFCNYRCLFFLNFIDILSYSFIV